MALLKDRVVVLTGAASGIGRSTALRAIAEGAIVVAVDRDAAALDAVAAEAGTSLRPVVGDVTNDELARNTLALAAEDYGRLDGLATIAGISRSGIALTEIEPATWDEIFAVNVRATWQWIRHAVPHMKANGGGAIVTVASQLAFAGGQRNAAYIASKGAVVSLTKTAAVELAPDHIRVNAVAPGAIETPLLEQGMARQADPAGARERSRTRHAMQRFGQPEEIANGIVWLLSEQASLATGSTLVLDGGWLAA